ncbi:MAG: flagellar type III secretion system protein FlhB [Rhodobacteraceae bacterium]|jgi:flagellar biosynthetic protein FlhB|nr:flagellar type III secretion system protein FlhB [Paracoccaceae bacterium]
MSDQDEAAEKTHDPTPHRLEEARKKGDVARSPEVNSAMAFLALLAGAYAFGGSAFSDLALGLQQALASAVQGQGSATDPTAAAVPHVAGRALAGSGAAAVLLFAVPATAVIAGLVVTRAVTFSPDKLVPKANRLDPIANLGQKFGPTGLVEFARGALKLVAVSVCLVVFGLVRLPDIIAVAALEPAGGATAFLRLFVEFLALVVAISVPVAVLDLLWQHFDLRRRNRMSRKDLLDEMKSTEGDPMLKQQRRQRGQEIATNRMLDKVAEADVVIVNPTHYAVALTWARTRGRAPVCVAKGTDEIALRIRERAAAAGVPLHRDPATARALFATVGLDDEITPAHYRAVAAAIRFADRVRAARRR